MVIVKNESLLPADMSAENFFSALFPSYGEKLDKALLGPRWIPGLKGWLVSEYLNDKGNLYYWLVRFCDNMLIVERDAIWGKGNITYLDDLAIFKFSGHNRQLIDSKKYHKVKRDEEFIRGELEAMLINHVKSEAKLHVQHISEDVTTRLCKENVERSFKDFLDDDYEVRLMSILPMLEYNENI